jgi:hypothetical protein
MDNCLLLLTCVPGRPSVIDALAGHVVAWQELLWLGGVLSRFLRFPHKIRAGRSCGKCDICCQQVAVLAGRPARHSDTVNEHAPCAGLTLIVRPPLLLVPIQTASNCCWVCGLCCLQDPLSLTPWMNALFALADSGCNTFDTGGAVCWAHPPPGVPLLDLMAPPVAAAGGPGGVSAWLYRGSERVLGTFKRR